MREEDRTQTDQVLTDQVLIELAKKEKGDDALGELFQRYRVRLIDAVYRLISRSSGTREDAEDIVTDTWISIQSAFSKYRGASTFYTWVYKIARNKSIDFLRSLKPQAA